MAMSGIASSLGEQVRRLRERRGWTLSGLAERCGLAKSTLSSLEAGTGNPTVGTLWLVASVLDVPFSALLQPIEVLPQAEAAAQDPGSTVRLIEQHAGPPLIELYAVDYAVGYRREAPAHPAGVREKVTVLQGALLVGEPDQPRLLWAGQSHEFAADQRHLYAAFDGPCRALVLIEYPRPQPLAQSVMTTWDWPQSEAGWAGLRAAMQRALVEVSQGVSAAAFVLRAAPRPLSRALEVMTENLQPPTVAGHGGWVWPVCVLAGDDGESPYLGIFPLHHTGAFSIPTEPTGRSVFDEALRLARWAQAPGLPTDDQTRDGWRRLAASDSWTLSALAAENLNLRGEPCLPAPMQRGRAKRSAHVAPDGEAVFSSRIDVDDYDAFELLHPAYARQIVAMAEDALHVLPTAGGSGALTLDIGSGPGVSLLMLLEMLPLQQVTAIESDANVFACLQRNLCGNGRARALAADFLQANLSPQSFDLLTSTGASRHLNTAFMLQQAFALLRPGGYLLLADEFLPPFTTPAQRNLALIRHHGAYLLAVMAGMGPQALQALPSTVLDVFVRLRSVLGLALLSAESGREADAVARGRQLLSIAEASVAVADAVSDATPEQAAAAQLRFFRLELQAMAAGFDYEVERKTHARRFKELACLAGFEVFRHRRVFATVGGGDWDGGTHVFALRKPLAR